MSTTRNKQATLPENLQEATVDSMMTGQVAYMVPWGMWVDNERACWLHPKYTIYAQPGGTVVMRVELRQDGYHVWPTSDHKYSPTQEPGYASPSDTQYIPVAQLHS